MKQKPILTYRKTFDSIIEVAELGRIKGCNWIQSHRIVSNTTFSEFVGKGGGFNNCIKIFKIFNPKFFYYSHFS